MTLTERDRKIVLVVIPIVIALAYWFLLLAPKREEASKAGEELTAQEQKRDEVTAKAARLESAKATFARDYRDVVRLGKAIPSTVDMPSLIVQLDRAARGTGIKFTKVKTGERATAPAAASQSSGSKGGSGSGSDKGSAPASGGSQPTQSQPGSAAQTANNAADNASQQTNARSSNGGDNPTDTTTSSSSKPGGVPVGGGSTAAAGGQPAGSAAPGLDSVPLEFTFDGSFFELADFFHRLKRFVRVTNKDVLVHGRLMTIDGMKFASEENHFPDLSVEVKATVYLSPKGEGTTAGASPQGPATTRTAAASSEDSGSPAAATPPTATATP